MTPLVRLYIRECVVGFALAAMFVGGLLWLNIANLWHLISTSDVGWMALFLLWFFHGLVFGSVQFGITLMRLGEDEDTDRGGSAPQEAQPHPIVIGRDDRR